MNNFIFQNATKVYFGKGCVKEYLSCLTSAARTVMLAYGGGSVMDCCKAISLAVLHPVYYRHIYKDGLSKFVRFAEKRLGDRARRQKRRSARRSRHRRAGVVYPRDRPADHPARARRHRSGAAEGNCSFLRDLGGKLQENDT